MNPLINSPFLIVEHFISPAICERLISELGVDFPSIDEKDRPLKNERILKDPEYVQLFKNLMQGQVHDIEQKFKAAVVGMEPAVFSQYFEDAKNPCEYHGCENAKFIRKKWVKSKDVDLVGFIWLKDYGSGVPLDPRIEVYGGKLEFPAYNFSLIPQRGTLVLFPAGPHFISAISPVLVGSLELIKITVKMKSDSGEMYFYDPKNHPGTYQEWFAEDSE